MGHIGPTGARVSENVGLYGHDWNGPPLFCSRNENFLAHDDCVCLLSTGDSIPTHSTFASHRQKKQPMLHDDPQTSLCSPQQTMCVSDRRRGNGERHVYVACSVRMNSDRISNTRFLQSLDAMLLCVYRLFSTDKFSASFVRS